MAYKSIIRRRELTPNTFLNGVGATYTTRAQLASIMSGIAASDIRVFKNDGINISCLILKDYNFSQNSLDRAGVSAFLDYGGFLTSTASSFQRNTGLFFHSKSVDNIGATGLRDILNGTFYIPEVTDLTGANKLNDSTGELFTKFPNQTTSFDGTIIEITDNTPPDRIVAASVSNVGATFMTVNITDPASTNALGFLLLFRDGIFERFVPYASSYVLYNLKQNVTEKYQLVMADEFFNLSFFSGNLFTVTRPAVSPTALAVDAVANYPFDETTGDAIDTINGEDGTLIGSISRDGEYYTFGGSNAVVQVPNNANLNFIDGNGANVDFTIKTEFVATAFNSQNRFWIVSKRESDVAVVQGWQLIYSSGVFGFFIWSDQDERLDVRFTVPLILNKHYMVGVSCIGSNLFLYIDGVQVATVAVPNGFVFVNATSKMELGNSSLAAALNFIGKQKRTVILKGRGWTQQDWSDAYNGGNGIDI
jgi:hypothetical protein